MTTPLPIRKIIAVIMNLVNNAIIIKRNKAKNSIIGRSSISATHTVGTIVKLVKLRDLVEEKFQLTSKITRMTIESSKPVIILSPAR